MLQGFLGPRSIHRQLGRKFLLDGRRCGGCNHRVLCSSALKFQTGPTFDGISVTLSATMPTRAVLATQMSQICLNLKGSMATHRVESSSGNGKPPTKASPIATSPSRTFQVLTWTSSPSCVFGRSTLPQGVLVLQSCHHIWRRATRNKTLAPSEYAQPRAEEDEIWDQIVTDLEAAAVNLPLKSAYSTSQTGHPRAANALLAKAYLYMGNNRTECRSRCEEVVGSGEYFLDPNYGDIFTEAGENGPGSIQNPCEQFWGQLGRTILSEGTYTNVFQRTWNVSGYGFNLPTQDFVDEFEGGKSRMILGSSKWRILDSTTQYAVGDNASDWGTITTDATGMTSAYYPRKYFNPASELAPFGDPNPNGGSNDRVIRLADVLDAC